MLSLLRKHEQNLQGELKEFYTSFSDILFSGASRKWLFSCLMHHSPLLHLHWHNTDILFSECSVMVNRKTIYCTMADYRKTNRKTTKKMIAHHNVHPRRLPGKVEEHTRHSDDAYNSIGRTLMLNWIEKKNQFGSVIQNIFIRNDLKQNKILSFSFPDNFLVFNEKLNFSYLWKLVFYPRNMVGPIKDIILKNSCLYEKFFIL